MNRLKTDTDIHPTPLKFWVIIPAAGVGSRFGSSIPKQYLPLNGRTVLEHSIEPFRQEWISQIIIAVSKEDNYIETLTELNPFDSKSELKFNLPEVQVIIGGSQRADTVLNALDVLSKIASPNDFVFVHDAARPCLTLEDLSNLKDAVLHLEEDVVGALLVAPVVDTIKKMNSNNLLVTETVDRQELFRALTPQVFPIGLLRDAMLFCNKNEIKVTDESSAIEAMGLKVKGVLGKASNIKLTLPEDYISIQKVMELL